MMDTLAAPVLQRRRFRVRGRVQGVGFRPFVYRLATELALDGFVRNDGHGVAIEVEGDAAAVDAFARRLRDDAPGLARVEQVDACACEPRRERGFSIAASESGGASTAVAPDTAPCPDCLAELFDRADRRWRHPFITCTQCGPRFTLLHRLPYDRAQTSMARFAMCARCAAEYADPAHRRFHAEPIACPDCGPRLSLRDATGRVLSGDPIVHTLELLRAGAIVAIKGLGGYHLACDASYAPVVRRLRERKARDEKPFAVMVANAASIDAAIAAPTAQERALLESPERPVVLCAKRAGCDERLPGAAPGLSTIGLMLPCTPIQFLLFHEAAGRPDGTAWLREPQPLALVMTSANPGGEPIVIDDADALARLAGIADAWLVHDRAIVARCDDSVVKAGQFIRRARGHVPQPVKLARSGPPVLATGAHLKPPCA